MTREIHSWLSDMDGVLVHEGHAIPGAPEFVTALRDKGLPFLVLTNNSIFTPRDLRARLAISGIDVPEVALWTSALATAQFLKDLYSFSTFNLAHSVFLKNFKEEFIEGSFLKQLIFMCIDKSSQPKCSTNSCRIAFKVLP